MSTEIIVPLVFCEAHGPVTVRVWKAPMTSLRMFTAGMMCNCLRWRWYTGWNFDKMGDCRVVCQRVIAKSGDMNFVLFDGTWGRPGFRKFFPNDETRLCGSLSRAGFVEVHANSNGNFEI